MQVKCKSRKSYEHYFNMLKTLNANQGFPFWKSLICVAKVFLFPLTKNIKRRKTNDQENKTKQRREI